MAVTNDIEVVFALPEIQKLIRVQLPDGASVADAVSAAGFAEDFPEHDVATAPLGIWGQVVPPDRVVMPGDRVEVYRPLRIDPREARRQLADSGQTMRQELRKDAQKFGSSS